MTTKKKRDNIKIMDLGEVGTIYVLAFSQASVIRI